MADPTINGVTLSIGGTHTRRNAPRARVTVSQMPSIDGAFTQRFGHGPRNITGRGVLRAASYLLMKSAVETIAEGTNHAPTDYVDADGSSHANCILMQYERVGEIHIEDDTSWWCDVRWVVFQQVSA